MLGSGDQLALKVAEGELQCKREDLCFPFLLALFYIYKALNYIYYEYRSMAFVSRKDCDSVYITNLSKWFIFWLHKYSHGI